MNTQTHTMFQEDIPARNGVQTPTITKAEIAEHFVTLDQLHQDLKNLVHAFYGQQTQRKAAV